MSSPSSSSPASAKKASRKGASSDDSSSSPLPLSTLIWSSVAVYVAYLGFSAAYNIRLFAIKEYGTVIHEFDPWFNARAAEVRYAMMLRCLTNVVV
jgi:hypothetical protein